MDEQLDRIEAILNVLLHLERERRSNELKIPFESAVLQIDQLHQDELAAARSRRRNSSS
jgi:hypothetical protein